MESPTRARRLTIRAATPDRPLLHVEVPPVPPSSYREVLPPLPLAGHVLCVWSQAISGGESAYRHRVLPDGCADVVWIGEAPAMVAGPATGPVVVPLSPGTVVIGVRLRPGAASALLGLPASELLDRDTPLADIRPGNRLCLHCINWLRSFAWVNSRCRKRPIHMADRHPYRTVQEETTIRLSTEVIPRADHTARSTSSRSAHEPTVPVRITALSSTATLTRPMSM